MPAKSSEGADAVQYELPTGVRVGQINPPKAEKMGEKAEQEVWCITREMPFACLRDAGW